MNNRILQRFDLSGKVAVITGAGGELCGAMAEGLGVMGVTVAILDISLEKAEIRARSVIGAGGFRQVFDLKFLHLDPVTGEFTPRAREVIAHTPMERYGDPADLIGTAVWLLSDASRFVTGVVVPIDGGFSSYTI